jgi:hypothetical protein
MKERRQVVKLSLPVLLMVVGGGWCSDAAYNWHWSFGEQSHLSSLAGLTIGLVLFFGSAYRLYRLRKEYLPVRMLERTRSIQPRKAVIAMVSAKNFSFERPPAGEGPVTIAGREGAVALKGMLGEDIMPIEGLSWNWQQLLRAIHPHRVSLEKLYLVGSSDIGSREGSFRQLEECADLLRRYLPPTCELTCGRQDVNFEDIDALSNYLEFIIKELRGKGYEVGDIMVDATGGMKTTSIAAAMVTLSNPRLHFQYVPTLGGGECQPLTFNVVAENQPEMA